MKKALIALMACFLTAVSNAELRTWTAVNGNKVKANFVSSSRGIVKLRLESGKVFEIPKDKLSKEDHEFIADLYKVESVGSGIKKSSVNSDLSERIKEFRNYYEKEKKELRDKKYERFDAPWVYIGNFKTFERNLTIRNKIVYKVNSEVPFTGWRYETASNGQIREEDFFLEGKTKISISYDGQGRGNISGEGNWSPTISKVYYEVFWTNINSPKPTRMWEHFGYGGKSLLTIGYNEKGLPNKYKWKTSSRELPSLKDEK